SKVIVTYGLSFTELLQTRLTGVYSSLISEEIEMSEWFTRLAFSFANQAGNWFIGFVLLVLSVFSTRLVETIKLALNRADARTKYFDEMATDISRFVFMIDRIIRVYYESHWADDDSKSGIAQEYDEAMNTLSRKEYVYLSWFHRYWGKANVRAFELTMSKVR